MIDKVYVGVEPELFSKFFDMADLLRGRHYSFGKPRDFELSAGTWKPTFLRDEEIEHFRKIGIFELVFGKNERKYTIYISRAVLEPRDSLFYAELPASVLDTDESFIQNVLLRIRNRVGSVDDN